MPYPGKKQWYVVYSKPKKEKLAQFYLRLKGFDVFFPRLLLPESSSRRKRIIPLFPNYLFVRIDFSEEHHSEDYYHVLWTPGVKRFVAFDDVPVPLDSDVVRYLMQRANPEGIIKASSNLKVGQEVRISGGPFDGLVGMIKDPPDTRGRVRVLMSLLSREVQVDVPLRFVGAGWIASPATKD